MIFLGAEMAIACPHCKTAMAAESLNGCMFLHLCESCDYVLAQVVIADRLVCVQPSPDGLMIDVFHPKDRESAGVFKGLESVITIAAPSDSFVAPYRA